MMRWRVLAAAAVAVALLAGGWPQARADYAEGEAALRAGDFATALRVWRPLAEAGLADAQNDMGVMYGGGFGVARDDAAAAGWFRRAAEQGHARGAANLARLYFHGLGVPQDLAEAARYYKQAALTGYAPAQGQLGQLFYTGQGVPRDIVRAYFWWTLAAQRGDHESTVAREAAAYMMTPHQIRVGNILAEHWQPEGAVALEPPQW